jgi:hypothetical protein
MEPSHKILDQEDLYIARTYGRYLSRVINVGKQDQDLAEKLHLP